MERADSVWKEFRGWAFDKEDVPEPPSTYFRRQVYGCWFFEETALQRLVDVLGPGNILFETDYPHPICLHGNVREKIDAALAGHPPELRRQLLFDNAAALYRVEQPPAAP